MPSGRDVRRLGRCIIGDVTRGEAQVVEGRDSKNSNFIKVLTKALQDAQLAIGASPKKLSQLVRKAEEFRDALDTCKHRDAIRTFHNRNRNSIHQHDADIARFVKDLKDKRDFWWAATRDEVSLPSKDEALADLLATAAWLAAQLRDDVIHANEALAEARRFVAAHKSALAQLDVDAEATQDAESEDAESFGRMRGGRDDSPVQYNVVDRDSPLNGTLCASSLLDDAGVPGAWK
jgi:hypothetical protein